MTNDFFSVALCTNRQNANIFEPLAPSLIVFSEKDLRLFVCQADLFYSETEISDDLSAFLVSIGVRTKNQFHVDDLGTAFDVKVTMALRNQLAATDAALAAANAAIETMKNSE